MESLIYLQNKKAFISLMLLIIKVKHIIFRFIRFQKVRRLLKSEINISTNISKTNVQGKIRILDLKEDISGSFCPEN